MLSLKVKEPCCPDGLGRALSDLRSECTSAGTRTDVFGRKGLFAGSFFPAVLLFLMPKCPLCIVAYVATVSGIGISVSAAAGIRITAIMACVATFLVVGALAIGHRDTNPANSK